MTFKVVSHQLLKCQDYPAKDGCNIAFMDKNKDLGRMIKEELENVYHVPVFFFHGDIGSEEDRDIFFAAVKEMFGKSDYIICKSE